MHKLYKVEDETGEKKIYLPNITDEVIRIIMLHDIAVENGANSVMLNAMPVGLSACRMLRKHTKVPLFSHFDFIAPFTRIPSFGMSSELVTKLERLIGFDAIIMPGFGERMMTPDQEVYNNIAECLNENPPIKKVLPLPGGSDWAASVPFMFSKIKSIDFGMVPGRGVFAHPNGPEAGAKSLRQAWEAVQKGFTLEDFARSHIELYDALQFFQR
jgi:ribulose-bisphosphate carboxylase large chain